MNKLMDKQIWDALKKVIDPEVGYSVVDMGLVYKVEVVRYKVEGFLVIVKMTLTSPGCPLASTIEKMVRDEVSGVPGVSKVKFVLVWEPVWSPFKMSADLRAEMGYD
jgi:metal-sulfur cluster biosynthetic enzyme